MFADNTTAKALKNPHITYRFFLNHQLVLETEKLEFFPRKYNIPDLDQIHLERTISIESLLPHDY